MDSKKIKVRWTRDFGRGVFALEPIKKGELIAEFDGAMYDDTHDDWNDDLYNHVIQFARNRWRDSKGVARYLNHSCEPNCGIRGLFKVVAMRDISPGEHLTWDYEMTERSDNWRMRCKCGSPYCRKVIGNYNNMPRSVRKKYGSYISLWLRRSKRKRTVHATKARGNPEATA